MKIRKIWAISYSPTGTSKKIVKTIAAGFPDIECGSLDLTVSGEISQKRFDSDELVLISVPVYAGRVAPLAAERMQALLGNQTPAVLVVLYGNRAYEDALIELRDLAAKASFLPVAAAAFIGEHSFSGSDQPIAAGRPDAADLDRAKSFSQKITDAMTQRQSPADIEKLYVPGNVPYKEGVGPIPVTPKVDQSICTSCGLCVSSCPNGAIAIDGEVSMDVERCTFCCACIKNCPENAVAITAPPLLEKRQWLFDNCGERKEPEFYL